MAATGAAALFMGTCSGHGKANGVLWQPGPGGGFANPCPHASLAPQINTRAMPIADNFATWTPWPQQPATTIVRNVMINNLIPIIDQDDLVPHPTFTQHKTMSVGKKCFTVRNTPAWHCTLGTAAGREASTGHARRLFATTKTVFINNRRAGRFADPFGNGTTPFPCLSVVSGSSKNVFIGG